MPLSIEEKAKLGDIYERNRRWGKNGFPAWALVGLVIPATSLGRDFFHRIHAPDAGQHTLGYCLYAFLAGAAVAAIGVRTVLVSRLRKRDAAMLEFVEKQFPDECPWREEAVILRQAEELQREAKAGNAVAAAMQAGRA